jgi:hypothetical protein
MTVGCVSLNVIGINARHLANLYHLRGQFGNPTKAQDPSAI